MLIKKQGELIDKYYSVAECVNNDIYTIALILTILQTKPKASTVRDLEKLTLAKYEDAFDFILDSFKINTIKNLQEVLNETR